MALPKAPIKGFITGAGETLTFQFNPPSMTTSKGLDIVSLSNPGALSPELQFDKGGSRTIDVTLYFDSRMKNTIDVEDALAKIEFIQESKKMATFNLGEHIFDVYITSVSINRVEFAQDMRALKASVSLSMLVAYEQPNKRMVGNVGQSSPSGIIKQNSLAGFVSGILGYSGFTTGNIGGFSL